VVSPVKKLRTLIDEYIEGRLGGVSRGLFLLVFVIWTLIQIVKATVRDRCLQMASSLAYKTVLALVPLLAVSFALLKAFGAFDVTAVAPGVDASSSLVRFLSENFIPVQGAAIAGYIQGFADRISVGALGGIGVATLFFVAVFLFLDIESVFNDIFRTEVKRTLFQRFTTFYALVTLGPALFGLSLFQTAQYVGVNAWVRFVLPTMTTFVALALSYKLLPSTRVRWYAAGLGALAAAIGFEAAKVGFRVYVVETMMKKASAMYGALALFPIFLVWIYVTWLIILVGCEIAHTAQNIHGLTEKERGRRTGAGTAEAILRRVTPRFAARVFLAVATRFARGDGPYPLEELRHRMAMGDHEATYLTRRLREAGLVLLHGEPGENEGYMPSRPLHRISLQEVCAVAQPGPGEADDGRRRGGGGESPAGGPAGAGAPPAARGAPDVTEVDAVEVLDLDERDELDMLLDEAERASAKILDKVTFADLVSDEAATAALPAVGVPARG
jgi:membrane protein